MAVAVRYFQAVGHSLAALAHVALRFTRGHGGTFRLIDKVFSQWGISYTAVALTDLDRVRAAVTDRTKLVWVETPTNPLLSIVTVTVAGWSSALRYNTMFILFDPVSMNW